MTLQKQITSHHFSSFHFTTHPRSKKQSVKKKTIFSCFILLQNLSPVLWTSLVFFKSIHEKSHPFPKKIPSNSSLCLAGDKGVAALKGDKPPRSSLGDSNYGPSIHGTPGSDFTTVLIVLEQSFLYPTLGGSSRNHGKRWCFFFA